MRSVKAGVGILVVLALAFGVWSFLHRPGPVFRSVIEPVEVTIRPPQYVAEMPHRFGENSPGLVVRAGGEARRVPAGTQPLWLNDGRLLVGRTWMYKCAPTDRFAECSRGDLGVLDTATGRLSRVPALPKGTQLWDMPGEGVHRVNIAVTIPTAKEPREVTLSLAADLADSREVNVPREPDGGSYQRSLGNRVYTIGEWDYELFSDGDEESSDERGYLRQRHGQKTWEKVLLKDRLVALWVSRDGRALLGLQQKRGEPCGGCSKAQQIVEIDPVAGKVVGSYGVPGEYDKTWRVGEIDKVDDRVLVRYVHRSNVPENLGVWQYDGDWSLVPGTDGPFTWWQGPDDRIEWTQKALFWVHGGKRTRLEGQVPPFQVESWRGAPGSLVPIS